MDRIRNDAWKSDLQLQDEISRLINEGFKRKEILSFMNRDFPEYAWSGRTLDRRIQFFDLSKLNNYSDPKDAVVAIRKEVSGPGKLLGIRAMQKKLNQVHDIRMPRDVVHCMMGVIDPDGLEQRKPMMKKKKKGNFVSPGPNYVYSLDGHDKLMGFQNSMFPLAIYGCIDTCSRKIMWVKVWSSNKDPKYPALWYFQHLGRTKTISRYLRVDKGTETIDLTCMHAMIIQNVCQVDLDEASDSVIFGPSTSNQIERWWKELHERLEKFFKEILNRLYMHQHYDSTCQTDRDLIAYIMIPLLQEEIDCFVKLWNIHRIRKQKGVILPDGIPDHIYNFPAEYGLEEQGLYISKELLENVQKEVSMADESETPVDADFMRTCDALYKKSITNNTIYNAFVEIKRLLKRNTSYYDD